MDPPQHEGWIGWNTSPKSCGIFYFIGQALTFISFTDGTRMIGEGPPAGHSEGDGADTHLG